MVIEELQENLRSSVPQETTIEDTLGRGVETLLPNKEGLVSLMQESRIRLYLGIDPTSPDLHIGHLVPLRKLRQFQNLGHEVILLFGTFTGMIGDPTDKSAGRVRLDAAQIGKNIETYEQQASKVLDLSKFTSNPILIKHNHEWLQSLTFSEVVDLAANFSVQQMEARSMFQDRIKEDKPIWLHEFLYPLMQGYDSVFMDIDLEVGGKDQIFNMLVGRDLMKRYHDKEKWVLGNKLIEDPSGKKMGKTEGNIVNINEWPEVKYEALMTWPDGAISTGFELLTLASLEDVKETQTIVETQGINPMIFKEAFAYRVISELDGKEAADYAEEEFSNVKRKKMLPRRIKEVEVNPNLKLNDVLVLAGLAKDEAEAFRYISAGAVVINGKDIRKNIILPAPEVLIQIGRRTIKNIRLVKFDTD